METEPERNKHGLTHIIIPGEVGFNTALTHTDKLIWWVIRTLDISDKHCFATNKYIAKRAFVKERTVTTSIATLVGMGYLKVKSASRDRVLIIEKNLEQFSHILESYNDGLL